MIMFLDIPSDEMMSPTSKSSRSDSRTSFGSIFDSPMKDKSIERVRLVVVLTLRCLFLAYLFSFISLINSRLDLLYKVTKVTNLWTTSGDLLWLEDPSLFWTLYPTPAVTVFWNQEIRQNG